MSEYNTNGNIRNQVFRPTSDNTCKVNVRHENHVARSGQELSPHTLTQFASDLSQRVLQMRRRRFELTTPPLNDTNHRLYHLPSVMVQREAFIGDRGAIADSFQGESRQIREGQ
jgi:hypothetical protein